MLVGFTMLASQVFAWLLCIVGFSAVTSRTIFLELNAPTPDEFSFLKKYGYLSDVSGVEEGGLAFTPHSISEAIKKMQDFAGLSQTGIVDSETKKLFKRKRCGVKDIDSATTAGRSRRYIIQQGWDKTSISYRVINGSSTLDKARVEVLMAAGLAVWAPHGGLEFTPRDSGDADITVFFASGEHGDGFPFDGQGRVVAHAFPPPHGAMHFDDDEVWGDAGGAAGAGAGGADDSEALEDDDVTDFFAVAVHEIGHALGLSHSNVKASVMYPYYQVPVETLHMDDILGMQELYLKKQAVAGEAEGAGGAAGAGGAEGAGGATEAGPAVPRFTKPDVDELDENYMPDPCMTNYDTLQVIDGKIYVFEEEWVWVFKDRNLLEPGYPQPFHDVFRGLPARLTTVRTIYQRFNGNVAIFAGRNYWEFGPSESGFRLVHRGKISDFSVPSYVPELTTVFVSNYNNKTYLIEEERFWRYDEGAREMDKGYPKEMSAWRQVPYPVDAAIIWKGDTYFFQGPRFWRFDNRLVAAHEYYPLPVAQIWFNCPFTPDMNKYVTNDGP